MLLIIAASVYFIVGEYADGITMLIFVLSVCTIEFIQEAKTDKALEELNKLSSLNVKVIRNGKPKIISNLVGSELVSIGRYLFGTCMQKRIASIKKFKE